MTTPPAKQSSEDPPEPSGDKPRFSVRLRRALFGAPRSLADQKLFHRLSLIPFLAWVGLGADGLSSSAYGPEEAFRTLGSHTYLAVALAALMAFTVLIISAAYSRIIEDFPHGGGGYVVASKLLGKRAGVVSGSALIIDYILTITVSLAAAGDALFSFLPPGWQGAKLPTEVALLIGLTALNARGVRESVMALAPVFLLFLATHAILLGGGIFMHADRLGETARSVTEGFSGGLATLGMGGMLLLFVHAYSLGGGTYTGIEAVSNGLPIMREPRVATAKRTMLYMAASLAITATGLLLSYLLWGIEHVPGKTMNAVLVERFAGDGALGRTFVGLTLLSEGALLVVAAQAGFLDGPRVLANMAIDSWMPHRFAALSERLTTQNGIFLMGAAALAALLYTGGDVRHLVVMYSINVFLTFSLSLFGMTRRWIAERRRRERWKRRVLLFGSGFILCATILVITAYEKFREGGWVTLVATGSLVALCYVIRAHYRTVMAKLSKLYSELGNIPRVEGAIPGPPDPKKATAAVLVANYGPLGMHTLLNIFRVFPGHFSNLVFVSVGVIDSGAFKGGEREIDDLRERTDEMLQKYVRMANGLGVPAAAFSAIGTDAVETGEKLCRDVAKRFEKTVFFSGKIVFKQETWYQRLLHNETAILIQRRLHWAGLPMVVMPARVH